MENQLLDRAREWLEAGGQAVSGQDYERAFGCAALAAYHAVDALCVERLGGPVPRDDDEETAMYVAAADQQAADLVLRVLEVSSGYTTHIDPDRVREPQPDDDWAITQAQAQEVLRDASTLVDHVTKVMAEPNGTGHSPP